VICDMIRLNAIFRKIEFFSNGKPEICVFMPKLGDIIKS